MPVAEEARARAYWKYALAFEKGKNLKCFFLPSKTLF